MSRNYVHHICIQTNQYEASLKFYQEVLGFEILKETLNFHEREYNTWLKLNSFFIELQTGVIGETLGDFNRNNQGIVHLCLWVENLDKFVEVIKNKGYKFKSKDSKVIYVVENGRLCKLFAPEGTIIELRDNHGI